MRAYPYPVLLTMFLGAVVSGCTVTKTTLPSETTVPTVPVNTELDLTGTWNLVGVECYSSNPTALTAAGTMAAAASPETLQINGNQMTSETTGASSCVVTESRTIQATLSSGSQSSGSGTVAIGSTTASTSNGAACSVNLSFDMSQGTLTTPTISGTMTAGDYSPSMSGSFVINQSYWGFATSLKVSGSPSDICFLIYHQQ